LALEAVHEPDPVYSIRSNSSISSVDEIGALAVDWDINSHLALTMALRLLAPVVASLLLLWLPLPLLDEVLESTDSSAGKETTFSILSFEAIHLPPSSEDDENDPADSFQES